MPSNSPSRYVIQRSYSDIDQLVSDTRQWDLDLRQIDCGLFQGETLQFGLEDIHIAEARFNRVLEQRGAPPAGLRTVGIPANQNVRLIWRGQQVNGNHLMVFPRGAELTSVSSPDFHVYTCSFSEQTLASLSEGLQVGELDQLRDTSEVISCRPDLMKPLQSQLRVLRCDVCIHTL